MDKLFNKEYHSAGSSGSADAAPRMTEKSERSAPDCHCETAQTKNNPANCFCAQSNETQKAKRQCGRIDVGIGATKQSGEIASHSFAMTQYKKCGRAMTGECGRSSPTCHLWSSVSATHAPKKGNCPVDNLIWGAMRHNESKWKTQDELMSELKSILPLKNKGSQRGFAQNPSCTFPYALREGQTGCTTPTLSFPCLTRESTERALNAPRYARFAQFGRSMVEMLGTLAIMGIIGITGIWGFNAAMNSHRANEVLYEVSKRAYGCMAQINLMGKECNLSEYGDKLEGYATSTLSFPNNYFGIKVAGVPEKICRQIHNKGLSQASQILPETCIASNDMIFIFDSELKGGTSGMPQKCTPETVNEDCAYKTAGNTCDANGFCTCANGQTLTPTGCCATGKVLDGACCQSIKEENGEKLCCWKTDECCPSGKYYYNGNCLSCEQEGTLPRTESINFCRVCSNRVWAQWKCQTECLEPDQIQANGSCHCPFDRPIMAREGVNQGKCFACSEKVKTLSAWDNNPIGYDREQIARYCNYRGGTGGYSYPCASGQVGLWENETHKNGIATKYAGDCVSCDLIEDSQLNSRARCESCGGTWESSQPGTQDEWMHGECKNRQL